jgi:hypothetical protein
MVPYTFISSLVANLAHCLHYFKYLKNQRRFCHNALSHFDQLFFGGILHYTTTKINKSINQCDSNKGPLFRKLVPMLQKQICGIYLGNCNIREQ